MDIIASRRHFEVTNKDIVMYDGACYQLTTQHYRRECGGNYHISYNVNPQIPKSRAEKLIKEGKLILAIQTSAFGIDLKYYKFNVEGAKK